MTAGQKAAVALVLAGTQSGRTMFLVPLDREGVSVTAQGPMVGFSAGMLARIDFDGVQVTDEETVGPVGFGDLVMAQTLNIGRMTVACAANGLLGASLDAAIDASLARTAAKPLHRQGIVQGRIGDMAIDFEAGRLLCRQSADLTAKRDPDMVPATWEAKIFNGRSGAQAAQYALQLCGAEAFDQTSPQARRYRDSAVLELIEGATDVGRLVVGVNYTRRTAKNA